MNPPAGGDNAGNECRLVATLQGAQPERFYLGNDQARIACAAASKVCDSGVKTLERRRAGAYPAEMHAALNVRYGRSCCKPAGAQAEESGPILLASVPDLPPTPPFSAGSRLRGSTEQICSIGWPALYSIFRGGVQPSSFVSRRLGFSFSSCSAAATTGYRSFFICVNSAVWTIRSCILGMNMISRWAWTIRA